MDQSSDIFVGGNHQKVVLFWLGQGDNGKSVTQLFFDKMLGEYGIKISTTLITGKKSQTGTASPELARAGDGVRLITFEEPSAEEEISIGYLKSMTGNDSYWARDLFEKGKSTKEIVPLFKIYFICLGGNTKVSLASGISVSIKYLSENGQKLLSWNRRTDSLVCTGQTEFVNKGMQDCLEITLLDGRKITCTPEHKFLTSEGIWIQAQDITLDNKLKMGVDYPCCDDIFTSYDEILDFSDSNEFKFNLSLVGDRIKAMSYIRLISYMSFNKLQYTGLISVINQIDCENILEDIFILTGKKQAIVKNGSDINIYIPDDINTAFYYSIFYIENIILEKVCPLFIIREYLATLFSSDLEFKGTRLVLNKSVVANFDNVQKILLKFNINSSVILGNLVIEGEEDLYNFCENIGFRYNHLTNYQSTFFKSYFRYKKFINEKNSAIVSRCVELRNSGSSILKSHIQSVSEFDKEYGIINDKYTVKYCDVRNYIMGGIDIPKCVVDLNDFNKMLDIDKCIHGLKNNLACFSIQVIKVTETKKQLVYDIGIDNPYNNFLAEGVITHNCNRLPRFKGADKATWNRVRVIPFEATFVKRDDPEGCPDTYEEQMRMKRFPMDTTFSSRIPDLVEAFTWVLLEHRKNIRERIEPDKVRIATEMYRRQNDFYRRFAEESIIEEQGHILSLLELYENFCSWFKLEGFRTSPPLKDEVKEYFSSIWNEPNRHNKWKGYRMRTLKDDVDSGNAIILEEEDLVNYDCKEDIVEVENKTENPKCKKVVSKSMKKSYENMLNLENDDDENDDKVIGKSILGYKE